MKHDHTEQDTPVVVQIQKERKSSPNSDPKDLRVTRFVTIENKDMEKPNFKIVADSNTPKQEVK